MIFFRRPEGEDRGEAKGLDELRGQISAAQLPEPVAGIVAKELAKLEKTDPSVAE
jgi:ATP-dependent Lon protease